MPFFTDQTGRKILINERPRRIISLVPSQTELLADLGLIDEVAGITKFCVHPAEWFRTKTRVGGTKDIKKDIIDQLQPDLIIANKEENEKIQIEELEKEFSVWISDVKDLNDAVQMILKIGEITGKTISAKELALRIQDNFNQLQTPNLKPRTCYLIWRDPYISVGADTFIHDMLDRCGFENIFQNKTRYPETTVEEIKNAGCELLLLSSEPYPFKQKHIDELKKHLPGCKIILVDGEMFSWYGSRLLKAPMYFNELLKMIKTES